MITICECLVYSYSVKHLHMKVVFVSAVCGHRFSCVLVSFPLVLCTGLCIHVDLTYWIVYGCLQNVDGLCCCIIVLILLLPLLMMMLMIILLLYTYDSCIVAV